MNTLLVEVFPPETLTRGLIRQYYADHRILTFSLLNMDDNTVDRWITECIIYLSRCAESEQVALVLQDLSAPNIIQTPYSRQQGQIATNAYPAVKGRIAYLLPESTSSDRIKKFMRFQHNQSRERMAFATREDALAWLSEWL